MKQEQQEIYYNETAADTSYLPPEVEIVEVMVERGMESSEGNATTTPWKPDDSQNSWDV